MVTDTERIDWLESQEHENSAGWIARKSFHGRGFRVHLTNREPNYPTVREAIDAAMEDEESDS